MFSTSFDPWHVSVLISYCCCSFFFVFYCWVLFIFYLLFLFLLFYNTFEYDIFSLSLSLSLLIHRSISLNLFVCFFYVFGLRIQRLVDTNIIFCMCICRVIEIVCFCVEVYLLQEFCLMRQLWQVVVAVGVVVVIVITVAMVCSR